MGSFSEYVSGFTSDHTYQSANITSYAKDGSTISLTGMTWNLLNQAHAKSAVYPNSNNPFDIDEFDQYYELRKRNQLRFLWHKIKSGTLDFILLQEVDVFTGDPLSSYAKIFLEKIRKSGWYAVHSEKSDDVKMPLLILYNTKTLSFESKRSVFLAEAINKKTAIEATFNYRNTGVKVCITNMHLDFNTDHRQSILEYQQQQISAGLLTIIGGDANLKPDKEHYSLVGDINRPTNISKPLDDQQPTDEGGKVLQRLDGFMASPAAATSQVEIIEGFGAYFKWVPANILVRSIKDRIGRIQDKPLGKYVCRTYEPEKERLAHTVHISSPGLPWIKEKFKHLLINQTQTF